VRFEITMLSLTTLEYDQLRCAVSRALRAVALALSSLILERAELSATSLPLMLLPCVGPNWLICPGRIHTPEPGSGTRNR